MITFTVVICTRDRPTLFATALESVLMQRDVAFDVIIVMDGSDPQYDHAYEALYAKAGEQVRVLRLDRIPKGHGHAYAANRAVAVATGKYLAFLDDDDCWTSANHLALATASIAAATQPVDAYFTNQLAYDGDRLVNTDIKNAIWLEGLRLVPGALGKPDLFDVCPVTIGPLMRVPGQCHLNNLIIRRDFYTAIGGLDNAILYEEDRDLYLRIADNAKLILYAERIASRHNIPNKDLQANFSTRTSPIDRRLFQLQVYDKSIVHAHTPAVVRHALMQKSFVLRHIAVALNEAGCPGRARSYAIAALACRFSLGWLGYCLRLSVRALLART